MPIAIFIILCTWGSGSSSFGGWKWNLERQMHHINIMEMTRIITIWSYGFPSIFEHGFIIFHIFFNIKSETIDTCPPLSPPKNNPAPTALFQAMTDDIWWPASLWCQAHRLRDLIPTGGPKRGRPLRLISCSDLWSVQCLVVSRCLLDAMSTEMMNQSWLVVEPTPLKNDGVKVSRDDDIPNIYIYIIIIYGKIKLMFQTTYQSQYSKSSETTKLLSTTRYDVLVGQVIRHKKKQGIAKELPKMANLSVLWGLLPNCLIYSPPWH